MRPTAAAEACTPTGARVAPGAAPAAAGARPRRPIAGVIVLSVALAALLGAFRGVAPRDRGEALASELERRGLVVDREALLWLEGPPIPVLQAAAGDVPVVVRAAPRAGDPHDIYLVHVRLSPEGVLLGVGGAYNLTETSAIDEQGPVGRGGRFAFAERRVTDDGPGRVRLLDLSAAREAPPEWSRRERAQAAVTRLQETGRLARSGNWTYTVEPAPAKLALRMEEQHLTVTADDRQALVALQQPADVPEWLAVEAAIEPRPGNLVTWAVDRVRNHPWVGDNRMQYLKAIAFSALDIVESRTEELTGDTGEEEIASDLGQESLELTRSDPVDPEIGFPPPALAIYVEPALPGEGVWRPKEEDGFIRGLPGLPPVFFTTFIRGDRRRKATRVYIALWDPRTVELHTMPGSHEPKSATGETGPGIIPREPAVMRRLVGAFNAGFQSLHGEYGVMSDGTVYLPPKPYGATVAVERDGSALFGTWPEDATVPDRIHSYRQNMTPIVVDGKWNPYGRTWWGGTPSDWEDKTHTVRTGICLTEEGFVGYFYGADLSPSALARAMMQARCGYGIALDMNAGHSGLEYYLAAPATELGDLGRPLHHESEREGTVSGLDGWSFRARRLIRGMGLMNFPRYIRREGRDFFYLTTRPLLPGPPLGDAPWRVKGLAQHGYPYALATTTAKLPGKGGEVVVLKVDPRLVRAEAEPPRGAPSGEAPSKPAAPTVLQVGAVAAEPGAASLWWSPGAFHVAVDPLVPGSVPLLAGPPRAGGPIAALACVQETDGMLVYVQASAPTSAVALQKLADQLGCGPAIYLAEPLPLALNGDTDLAGQATRVPSASASVALLRIPGPTGRRMFEDTPVVPLETWHPLQARRIRYFKKPKAAESVGN